MENFRRPNHNDFKDSQELRKEKFSGVRQNSISREWEIWVAGELRARGPQSNSLAFEKAFQEVFDLNKVSTAKLT